jgi:hypothetical protein
LIYPDDRASGLCFVREHLLDEALQVQEVAESRFPEKLQGDRSCQQQEDDLRSVTVHLPKLNRPHCADDHDLVATERTLLGLAGVRKGDLWVKRSAAEAFPLHNRRADSLLRRLLRALRQAERGSIDCVAYQDSRFRVRNVEKHVLLIHMRKKTKLGT